ncbi:hypothetical protein O181_090860 [Austropuccinia psidii MF-1]|uniref:Uncharacterized protein n=1 Tax=Austropuccinia psidii MF-1 TaxID=1389203 RepID=A0A9Q3IVT0_9BASI|nr:hypothetical protein [Austropuccinia psidii MF-1]
MIHAWTTCFIGDEGYFIKTEKDNDYWRNLVALSFIHNSVERQLFDSITNRIVMPNTRTIYQAIKNLSSKSSWSSIIHHTNTIFCQTTALRNINQREIELGEAVEAIENQIGPLDGNKIITLSLFFSVPHLQEQITAALDTRLSASPLLAIQSEDILDMIPQMSNPLTRETLDGPIDLSRIESEKKEFKRDEH